MEPLDDLLKWNMRGMAFVNWCNAIGTAAGIGMLAYMAWRVWG